MVNYVLFKKFKRCRLAIYILENIWTMAKNERCCLCMLSIVCLV